MTAKLLYVLHWSWVLFTLRFQSLEFFSVSRLTSSASHFSLFQHADFSSMLVVHLVMSSPRLMYINTFTPNTIILNMPVKWKKWSKRHHCSLIFYFARCRWVLYILINWYYFCILLLLLSTFQGYSTLQNSAAAFLMTSNCTFFVCWHPANN